VEVGFNVLDTHGGHYDFDEGVQQVASRLDGTVVSDTFTIDTYLLDAGLHTLRVSVADLLGNTGVSTVTFRVRATSASLLNNLERAWSEGSISDAKVYKGLKDKLATANKTHNRGQHPVEWNTLGAFIEQLYAQRGKGIDYTIATRWIGYAQDLIASRG